MKTKTVAMICFSLSIGTRAIAVACPFYVRLEAHPQKQEKVARHDEFETGPHKATPPTTYAGKWVQSVAIDRMLGNPARGRRQAPAGKPWAMEITLDKTVSDATMEKARPTNQLWKHRFIATGQIRFGRGGDNRGYEDPVVCLISHKEGNTYLWHEFV